MSQYVVLFWFKKQPLKWYKAKYVLDELEKETLLARNNISTSIRKLCEHNELLRKIDYEERYGYLYKLNEEGF